jgi:hypothetical protein
MTRRGLPKHFFDSWSSRRVHTHFELLENAEISHAGMVSKLSVIT